MKTIDWENVKQIISKADTYEKRLRINLPSLGLIAKKQRFDYLSWIYAEIIGNFIDKDFKFRMLETFDKHFIRLEMTLEGKTREYMYPILNEKNSGVVIKEVENKEVLMFMNSFKGRELQGQATSFHLNNSQQRGFAKLFSIMSGIGVKLFSGEDLAQYDNNKEFFEEEINEKKELTKIFIEQLKTNKEKIIEILKILITKRSEIAIGATDASGYINNLNLKELKFLSDEIGGNE